MNATATETPIPIRQAAREAHKSRRYVRDLIERGEITAFKSGGRDDAPRLRVKLSELLAAIERDSIYVPPALRQPGMRQGRSAKRTGTLHPAALGMRKRGAKRA